MRQETGFPPVDRQKKMPQSALTDTKLVGFLVWNTRPYYILGIARFARFARFALLDNSPYTFFVPTVMSRTQVTVGILTPTVAYDTHADYRGYFDANGYK